MTARLAVRRCSLPGALLLGLALVGAGCDRLPDEQWLRFLGFKQNDKTISILEGTLRGTTDKADAELMNSSYGVTGTGSATGIQIFRARVEYLIDGFSPPSMEYPLNVYLPAPTATTGSKVTVSGFPLAPVELKTWLLDTHAFDDPLLTPDVRLTARVTFFGRTDEGAELQSAGGIAITLHNTAP